MARQWISTQQHFLALLFERFDQLGEWPLLDPLQRELDRKRNDLDLVGTALTLPPELGYYESHTSRVSFTIRAIAYIPAAAPLLRNFLAVVRLLVELYLDPDHPPTVTEDDVRRLALDPEIWKRVCRLLENERFLLGGGQGSLTSDSWTRVLPTSLGKFQDVSTIEEYLSVQARLLWARTPGPARDSRRPSAPSATDNLGQPEASATAKPVPVQFASSDTPGSAPAPGMAKRDIMRLVNRYIGVSGGYLGDFSYRTHAEFYPEYCGIEIALNEHTGTTRERFIKILSSLPARDQAKVVRGVIERFPIGEGPASRDAAYRDELVALAQRLESGQRVSGTTPKTTSDVVRRAIADADSLLGTSGPISAVDRIHTALHGYVLSICDAATIPYPADASLTAAFKLLRTNHPKFAGVSAQSKEIERILFASATIFDAMNPVRNQASVAHPNPSLLSEAEAHLVIDVGRTLLNYLDAKISS